MLYSPSRPQGNFEVTENYGNDSVFSSSYVSGQYPNHGGQLRRRPIHTGEIISFSWSLLFSFVSLSLLFEIIIHSLFGIYTDNNDEVKVDVIHLSV